MQLIGGDTTRGPLSMTLVSTALCRRDALKPLARSRGLDLCYRHPGDSAAGLAVPESSNGG